MQDTADSLCDHFHIAPGARTVQSKDSLEEFVAAERKFVLQMGR
jgi:hypothetical protein